MFYFISYFLVYIICDLMKMCVCVFVDANLEEVTVCLTMNNAETPLKVLSEFVCVWELRNVIWIFAKNHETFHDWRQRQIFVRCQFSAFAHR